MYCIIMPLSQCNIFRLTIESLYKILGGFYIIRIILIKGMYKRSKSNERKKNNIVDFIGKYSTVHIKRFNNSYISC